MAISKNSKPRKRVAVFIGRFQLPHYGHIHILDRAFSSADAVVILVGSAFQARTFKNPFTYGERHAMLSEVLAERGYTNPSYIGAVRDQPYNETKWIQTVQEQVEVAIATFGYDDPEILLVGADRDASTWYLHSFPQWEQDFRNTKPYGDFLNATALREQLFTLPLSLMTDRSKWKNVPEATFAFLMRFIAEPGTHAALSKEYEFIKKYREAYSHNPYPPVFQTVDSVVIQSGHILTVVRGAMPGLGLWALPGGHVKPMQRLIDAAIDETIQETGIRLSEGKRSREMTASILKANMRDKEIFDDPNRSLRGRTFTTAFLFRLDDSRPLPKVKGQFAPLDETDGVKVVETSKAMWLPINEARAKSANWFEDHHAIIDTMVGRIKD